MGDEHMPEIPLQVHRSTSIAAYYALYSAGVISRKRWEALDILCRYARADGLTANEVFNLYRRENLAEVNFDSNTRARFTELREMGLIEERGEKVCTVSGKRCIAWAPTWSTEIKPYCRRNRSAKTLRRALEAAWRHPDCTEAMKQAIREALD